MNDFGVYDDGLKYHLLHPWHVDQRNEVGFDGETGSEYPVLVDEMYPHEDHPVQIASLDLHETVEYVNGLELRLRAILNEWQRFTRVPDSERSPVHWVEVAKHMKEAEDFFELNAYAYAHQRILERSAKNG